MRFFLACALAAALCCCSVSAANIEIDPSVLLSGTSDYSGTDGQARCQGMVNRANALTQSTIMFVPTLFWVSEVRAADATVNSQSNVSYFCYERYSGSCGSPTCCDPATQEQMQDFQSSMQSCMQLAVNAGKNIAISPHLDDGLGYGGWRNGLLMNPLENYGGMTYQDFMLNPLADALNAIITSTTTVDFAMQGEMSATVVYYPNEYISLLPTLKARVAAGRSSLASNVHIGISTNFDKICGCVLQNLVDTSQYLSLYPAAFAEYEATTYVFDSAAIQQLYSAVDFIGISSYTSLAPNFTINQIEGATYQYAQEIQSFGVDLSSLIFDQGKKLYWNEYGVGGGTNQDGEVKALTAADAAEYPFFGVFGTYTQANDPWNEFSQNSPPPTREYLFYFYNQTIAYLNSGGASNQAACPGCQYKIDGVYLWNSASWDIQAIYPESTSSQGSYYDPVLVAMFNAHNAAVSGQAAAPAVAAPTTSAPASTGVTGTSTGTGITSSTSTTASTAGRRLLA